jgi:hypothetical protein
MNANAVVRNYVRLTPEERFRLILAASGRRDEAERDRLAKTGPRISLRMPDHYPYAHAFGELASLIFIELLEEAAHFHDANQQASEAFDIVGPDEMNEDSDQGEENEDAPEEESRDEDNRIKPLWQRELELSYAVAYLLRTKANGWKLFCERLSIPPFLQWEGLPGFDRLQRALALTEKGAFRPDGFLSWLNRIHEAKGEPELTYVPVNATVEGIADAIGEMFKVRVE